MLMGRPGPAQIYFTLVEYEFAKNENMAKYKKYEKNKNKKVRPCPID